MNVVFLVFPRISQNFEKSWEIVHSFFFSCPDNKWFNRLSGMGRTEQKNSDGLNI